MSEVSTSGLRERKKERVRTALVEAALRLFAQRGFDGVTVDEIAAAAEVSRRTFFRYFSTKEAVIFARREEQLEGFAALLDAAGDTPPFENIRGALLQLSDDYTLKSRRIIAEQTLMRSTPLLVARDLEMDRAFESVMVNHLLTRSRRTISDRRKAKILAASIVGAMRVTLEEWAEKGGEPDLRRMGTDAIDLLAPLCPRAK